MRFLILLFFLSFCLFSAIAQESRNMTLLDNWFQDSLICNSSEVRYSDCYGFTWGGKEYAVIGSTEGTHVFLINDEHQFEPKGFVKGRFSNTSVSHRDYATYQNYLYAVCDEGVSSLQIIDLQYLPDSIHLAKEDSLQFGRVHNIFIDTVQQKFYSLIHRSTTNTQTIEAPMKIFSLADPLNLVELWSGPSDVTEVHDAYVRNGLSFLNCGYDGLRVYDFTNTSSPAYLESMSVYQDQGYNHQGWLTPSGNDYFFADETAGKRVKRCSFIGNNLSITGLFGTDYLSGSVPHNIMATDSFCYVAYYNLGLRVYDIRNGQTIEVAHFDTYPVENDPFPMNGNWGLYTLLPSQRILVADRQFGLFLLHFDAERLMANIGPDVTIYPNPGTENSPSYLRFPNNSSEMTFTVTDTAGKIVVEKSDELFTYHELSNKLSHGMYTIRGTYVLGKQEKSFCLRWANL